MVQNSRKAYSFYVVAFDAVLWSLRPSRTPRNENGRFSTLLKTIKAWSSCSLLKVQRRPDRADCRARREIFSHVCSLLEEKGFRLLSSSSERRPQNMRWYGPFYLSIKRNLGLNDNLWFKTQPMGENDTISNMMKTIVPGT